MERNESLYLVIVMVGVAALCWSSNVFARQNILIGGVGAGYNYWDRTYDEEPPLEDVGDRREFSVWPEFELQSNGIHDSFSIHYTPVLKYDDLEGETDVDHYLDLLWDTELSRQWRLALTDAFLYTSDPTRFAAPFETGPAEEPTEPPASADLTSTGDLSTNLGRTRYWTNYLSLLTTYSYAADSAVEFGYNYRILRNDSSDDETLEYDEYDRHGVVGVWSHSYSPAWSTELGLAYSRGDFEDLGDDGLPLDLNEYRGDLELRYSRDVNSSFPLGYRVQKADYKNLRDDVWGHELTVGWDHAFDSRNHLIVGAGPSYSKTDELSGALDYNVIINYIRTYQHGTIEALVDKRYLSRHFSGISDTGLVDATDVRLDFNYFMSRNVSFDIFGLYRYEEILNPDGDFFTAALGGGDPALESDIDDVTYTRDAYSAGAAINYDFLKWFSASLSYVYYQQDGDVSSDSYEDHRIFLLLTFLTELWR
jgi:hypothetical protein